jgi:hypothetical protein
MRNVPETSSNRGFLFVNHHHNSGSEGKHVVDWQDNEGFNSADNALPSIHVRSFWSSFFLFFLLEETASSVRLILHAFFTFNYLWLSYHFHLTHELHILHSDLQHPMLGREGIVLLLSE